MQDAPNSIDTSLAGLKPAEWKARLIAQADANGMHQQLSKRHFATFIDQNGTLLVTFESAQGIRALSETAQPFGFELVKTQGWSHLCIICDGDTWFRDSHVYEFFDQLIDDGFFEDFDNVVFYGAGPCGYAAAAFSVAAPGATVVAVQPQATLDPNLTEWDDRFPEMRRTSFSNRFGYAPDMLDAAEHAFVFYDPRQELDAMHSTMFHRSNVTRLRMRGMGGALQTRLVEMKILYRILTLAGAGKLTEQAFYRMYRARRENSAYVRALKSRMDADDRPYLLALVCRNVTSRMRAPKFRQRLDALEKQAKKEGIRLPPIRD
jgi:hypothetical protein